MMDASFAVTAFLVGFVAAYWYLRQTNIADLAENGSSSKSINEQNVFDAERADMAVQQLKDLAAHVALDVGAHNQIVTVISDRLGALRPESVDSMAIVSEALQEIIAANQKLQARLVDAEQKIQSQAEELRTQQTEARTDSLTKLANRRAFDDCLEKGMARYRKEGRPLSLLLFDVDHFKNFNDTYGHQAGDEVLRHVANTLSKTAKSTDLACRYGGEEFGLVMPNTSINQARVAAERIREAIELTKVNFEGKTLNVTASMGVAEIAKSDDVSRLIRRSDEAIYCSKRAGRNRGFWHDGEVCLPLDYSGEKVANAKTSAYKLLPDQATFATELQRRVSESQRYGHELTVMYLKVVGFTALEREFGDALSDLLLDSVSQFVGGTLRDMDLLGRAYPGEFMVMLPSSSEREATVVGNRIQAALSGCSIPLGGTKISLQVSVGVASLEPIDTANSLMARAQEAVGSNQKLVTVS
jgi:diguanylate cyclase